MDADTFTFTIMMVALVIALGYIFIDASKRRHNKRSTSNSNREPINVEELPQAMSNDNVIHSMQLRHQTLEKVDAMRAQGRNEDALELLASTISAADRLGLLASDKRLIEQVHGLAAEGSAGLYKVIFSQIINAMRSGDKDLVGTLLVTKQFTDIPPSAKEPMFALLIQVADQLGREDFKALVQVAQQETFS